MPGNDFLLKESKRLLKKNRADISENPADKKRLFLGGMWSLVFFYYSLFSLRLSYGKFFSEAKRRGYVLTHASPRLSNESKLLQPTAGLVFHYDDSSRSADHQPCEAAYLCSTGIPVRVLVPVGSIRRMEKAYGNLPGLPANAPKPVVCPLLLKEEHLDVTTMMSLMKVDADSNSILYMEVVYHILRELSIQQGGLSIVDYDAFRRELKAQNLMPGQKSPLEMRLTLLEAVMEKSATSWLNGWRKYRPAQKDINIWSFESGSLTIVDLSDPWINEAAACALPDIFLHLFKDLGPKTGKIVALAEAYKFMTSTVQSSAFTESLLKTIREQRHSGMRIVIATQEPTISPKLLDLCSMTIVHRFTSPDLLQTLKARLEGVATPGNEDSKGNIKEIFESIVLEPHRWRSSVIFTFCYVGSWDSRIVDVGPAGKASKVGIQLF
ncbi:MAG: hypothetical protein Q9208_003884 [Pyrenodesmia sp. 3 TL-2023]